MNNVWKSFDTFWSLPNKLFQKRTLSIQHIEAGKLDNECESVQAEVTDREINLTVYNSQKVYSLLTTVLYKKKILNENKVSQIYNQCTIN